MSDPPVPSRRRPVLVTIAVVLVYIGGVASVVIGTLILLSRYRVGIDLERSVLRLKTI